MTAAWASGAVQTSAASGCSGGDGLADGGIGCVRQTQPEGLVAAALGGVHAEDLDSRVNAFGQPGAAFAHAA